MSREIGALTPEDTRLVLDTVRRVQQSGILSPAYIDRIVRRIPLHIGGDGDGAAAIFLTPSTGIPAMSGSGPYTFGSATCTKIDGDGVVTSDEAIVYNSVSGPIPGDRVIQVKRIYNKWFVDVVDCDADEEEE